MCFNNNVFFAVVALSATFATSSAPVHAQAPAQGARPAAAAPVSNDPSATTAAYGDWVLRCVKVAEQPNRVCEVSQSVMVEGQTAPLVQIAVGRVAPKEPLRLTVALPNNVQLTTTPRVAIGEDDKQAAVMVWQRCLPGGCLADAAFSDSLRDLWRKTTAAASVSFTDGGGRPIAVPVSLRGLSQALDALGAT